MPQGEFVSDRELYEKDGWVSSKYKEWDKIPTKEFERLMKQDDNKERAGHAAIYIAGRKGREGRD